MIKNYIKIAFRNLIRQKGYSFINISGLAAGMACCILILLWVQDELSFDKFHENKNELYRLVADDLDTWYTSVPWALAPILKEEFPDIFKSTRVAQRTRFFKYQNTQYFDSGLLVDPDFFEMFTFPFVKGDAKSALLSDNSIVVSEEMGTKYFGDDDPMGKILKMDGNTDLTVT
ncbi:ABC transporter permease, partial [candidate division KSB1 bacterium]